MRDKGIHMVKKKGRGKLLVIYVSMIVILILSLYFISYLQDEEDDNVEVEFPQTLNGLELQYEYGGDRAMSEITNMHQGDFDIEEGFVGYYESGTGGSAYFWVSICADEAAAIDLAEKMTIKISTVQTPFSTPVSVSDDYEQVEYIYYTSGTGQDHYYWQDGELLIWVALDNMDTDEIKNFMDEAILSF
jgi:hypothetical protein